MPDYKEMYRTLFGSMTKAILIMQQAQQITEEMYIASEPPEIRGLDTILPQEDVSGGKACDKDE